MRFPGFLGYALFPSAQVAPRLERWLQRARHAHGDHHRTCARPRELLGLVRFPDTAAAAVARARAKQGPGGKGRTNCVNGMK